ncbi:hypothetical protein T265_08721 [Opisthorchis viverrini]|uniref:Uncharacterized protein n=1 Tax=Opisthorchis viverrini TaxID=6198 RepID=A0A074ZCP9_OPIVI|nr:hypothetical protein T265_08721 [Opisthorchis viverrini]KER23397.1 hypothetical protein T265_08721 [Opisthorchis viverrini]
MSVVRTRPLPLDFPCLGLGNLAISQPSCFLRVAWQLGTGRVLQLRGFFYNSFYSIRLSVETLEIRLLVTSPHRDHDQCKKDSYWEVDKYRVFTQSTDPVSILPVVKARNCLLEGLWFEPSPRHLDCSCLSLGNLAVSQPLCLLQVTCQQSAEVNARKQELHFPSRTIYGVKKAYHWVSKDACIRLQ